MKLELNINNLTFGSRTILKNCNFEFTFPGLYLFKGKNGSGKSTTLSILSGNFHNYIGQFFLNNQKITKRNCNDYIDKYVTYIPQDSIVLENLTCLENVVYPYVKKDKKRAKEILINLGLENVIKSEASVLSSGEKQRLAFARALYIDKPIILIDEITSNLDVDSTKIIKSYINILAKDHLIIFATHENIDNLDSYCLYDFNTENLAKTEYFFEKEEKHYNVKKIKNNSYFRNIAKRINEDKWYLLVSSIVNTILAFFVILFGCFFISSSLDNIESINYTNYINSSPSYMLRMPLNEAYELFEDDEIYLVEDTSLYRGERGIAAAGVLMTQNIRELTLVSGRYPESGQECLLSKISYDDLIKRYGEERVLGNRFLFGKFTIVGTYQNENPDLVKTLYIDNFDEDKILEIDQNHFTRISYSFMVENAFISREFFNIDKTSSEVRTFLVRANETSKGKISKDMLAEFLHLSESYNPAYNTEGIKYNPISTDANHMRPFMVSDVVTGVQLFFAFMILTVLFNVIFLIIYFVRKYNFLLILRVLGDSRKNQILTTLTTLFGYFAISFGLAMLLGLLVPCLMNVYFNNVILFSSVFEYIIYYAEGFLYTFYICLGTLAVSLFIVLILSPKNISKRLYQIKRK